MVKFNYNFALWMTSMNVLTTVSDVGSSNNEAPHLNVLRGWNENLGHSETYTIFSIGAFFLKPRKEKAKIWIQGIKTWEQNINLRRSRKVRSRKNCNIHTASKHLSLLCVSHPTEPVSIMISFKSHIIPVG